MMHKLKTKQSPVTQEKEHAFTRILLQQKFLFFLYFTNSHSTKAWNKSLASN